MSRSPQRFRHWLFLFGLSSLVLLHAGPAVAADAAGFKSALGSIIDSDLRRHVDVLADDSFEGREAGSRGGRAAGVYLGKEFQRCGLAGGAEKGYYQPFSANYRNILGLLEGSDPELKNELIVVGAHYDHVGYGNQQNSFGPIGFIHNGADDNASGTSALLELVEAFSKLPVRPKRSILFALWDGEEKGLLGSYHWLSNRTLPDRQVRMVVNMDMVGRLSTGGLTVYGVRTTEGLRRLVSEQNRHTDLKMDFTWEMPDNSDHWPFYNRGIPVLMLFTGLHDDYHRPSDDAEKVDTAGMQGVAQLLFGIIYELAQRPHLAGFRSESRIETVETQRRAERPLPRPRGRLGVRFDPDFEPSDGVRITEVVAGSAADRGGLREGDTIVQLAGQTIQDPEHFKGIVLAAVNPVPVEVLRNGSEEPVQLSLELTGSPVRVGIWWRADDAEPGTVVLTRVADGSPADAAGLVPQDRILTLNGQSFDDDTQFRQMVAEAGATVDVDYERNGQIRTADLELPEIAAAPARATDADDDESEDGQM